MREWRTSNICPDYEVCNYGTVRHIKTKEIVYPTNRGGSNLYVGLRKNGEFKYYRLDEIVADAFINTVSDCSNMKVIHRNDNRQDNRPENLAYIPKQPKKITYSNTKIKCIETGVEYHNLYECEADLGINIRQISECLRNGSMALEDTDGNVYNFEIIK